MRYVILPQALRIAIPQNWLLGTAARVSWRRTWRRSRWGRRPSRRRI